MVLAHTLSKYSQQGEVALLKYHCFAIPLFLKTYVIRQMMPIDSDFLYLSETYLCRCNIIAKEALSP